MNELQKLNALVFILLFSFSLKSQTLPVPTGLRIESSACGEITLAWDDYPAEITESGFKIYQSETENGTYLPVGYIGTNTLSYKVINLSNNKKYYFKLKGSFNDNTQYSDFGNTINFTVNCPIPQNLSVINESCNYITIKWDKVILENVLWYFIYRSEFETGPYTMISGVSGTNNAHADYDLIIGKTYFYKVKAQYYYDISDLGNAVSGSSNCPTIAPTLSVLNSECGKITLQWEDFPSNYQEIGYKIFFSENQTSNFYEVATVYNNTLNYTYQNQFTKPNKNYYFKIIGQFNSNYHTDFSNTVVGSYACPSISNFRITNQDCDNITLNWDDFSSPDSPSEVVITRSIKDANNFEYIGRTNKENLAYKDFSIQDFPKEYEYKIYGILQNYGTIITNESNIVTGKLNCVPVTGLQISSGNCNGATLTWDDLPLGHNETGYQIFYSDNLNKEYIYLASTAANILHYNFTNPYPWVKNHYFKVKAEYSYRTTYFSNIVTTNLSTDIQTVKSGNWWDPEVWSCSRVPKLVDIATINTGHNIVLNNENARIQSIVLNGNLNIENGYKLKLESAEIPQNEYEGCCGTSPVEFTVNTGKVYIPNVFTPNGDGINDIFIPQVNGEILEIQGFSILSAIGDTLIFSRSTIVFSQPENYGWNGKTFWPNGTVKSEYTGLFKYGLRAVVNYNGNIGAQLIEGYACVKRCTPDAAIFEDKNGCFYSFLKAQTWAL